MFLVLLDRESDEDEDYVVLKAYYLTWAEFLRFLCCITYMGVSGPSLLIESTDSMITTFICSITY